MQWALLLYDSFPVGQETIIENSMKFIALLLPKLLFECICRVIILSFLFFVKKKSLPHRTVSFEQASTFFPFFRWWKSVKLFFCKLVSVKTTKYFLFFIKTKQVLKALVFILGVCKGFIHVIMNLSRPINVLPGTSCPLVFNLTQEGLTLEKQKTLTSFYRMKLKNKTSIGFSVSCGR